MGIKKFPYLIHYRIHEESKTVYVEAMLHTSRNPRIWKRRTELWIESRSCPAFLFHDNLVVIFNNPDNSNCAVF